MTYAFLILTIVPLPFPPFPPFFPLISSGDSNIRGLNTTPGDELYSLYAAHDHSFRMEKKLEAYKAIMVCDYVMCMCSLAMSRVSRVIL